MFRRSVAFFIIALLAAVNLPAQQETRINQLFNFGWRFHFGDAKDAEKPGYDDAGWKALDLPHDFQINQPWVEAAGGARGFKEMSTGWYRKTFKADPAWKGKKVLLDFEGIMLTGDAWLNGEKIGGTDYGYLGFETDISKLLRYDGDNVVAVRASTGDKGASRWYTGGGLFRDVHLIVKNEIAVARHGVYITTPAITSQKATVNVQVALDGITNKNYNLAIRAAILAPDGKQVAVTTAIAPQRNKLKTVEVPLPAVAIPAPQLWSCETPDLYTAVVTLTLDGKPIDAAEQKFGIRTIEFSKEFGFRLNGKKVFLKGIANHHDLGAVGVAAYETAIARQMDQLKAFGFNSIRTSHNPYSEAFLRLADEKGILIVDELYDKWSNKDYWAGRKPWTALWFENEMEWIRRDRNHPSVILWSFGNELQMREDLAGLPTGDWGVTTYRLMNVLAKRYDSTRKTTVAMFPARAGGVGKNDPDFNTKIVPPELATVTDVSSFNYRWLNYPDYLKHAPNMIIYQSEATTNELVAPFYGMDRERMVGLAYWGAIEYWGESNKWPKKGWNYSYFDHTLQPNPQAYLIKSIFSDNPLVRIAVMSNDADTVTWNEIVVGKKASFSHWNWEAGKKYNVFTYTNADEVELFVNGKSFGVQKNNTTVDKHNMILWQNIPYSPGKITAVARKNGREVARHELETAGKAVGLKIEAEHTNWKADGMDLQYVKVYAVDSKGRRVYTASPAEVHFKVAGAAKLIAVDNGDQFSNELFDGGHRQLYNGFALAILRSGQRPGQVSIKVSADGLKPAEKKFITK
ncbi:glycoside hydrolase family 2 TIM barrel-domain containing protein [Niabella soli]|uniref:Beta-galactosidase n=1 Tax=Niabella soli DSM 19437 TaxID=929713 RepID=W0F0Z0_9BACT|nr:glycoside hydrolase family 2 TIM barrel-domain containing protein [Niabella soli]AHF15124.1 beta-galactosidase [Niabella soli DSM 19437]